MKIEVILSEDNIIEFQEALVKPTYRNEVTNDMIKCSHKYHPVRYTGRKNGHGVPTWYCVLCGHKVISM